MSIDDLFDLAGEVKNTEPISDSLLSYYADVEEYMWCQLTAPDGSEFTGGFLPVRWGGNFGAEVIGYTGWFRDTSGNLTEGAALVFNTVDKSWKIYFPKM
jgi:hypothetical protein